MAMSLAEQNEKQLAELINGGPSVNRNAIK